MQTSARKLGKKNENYFQNFSKNKRRNSKTFCIFSNQKGVKNDEKEVKYFMGKMLTTETSAENYFQNFSQKRGNKRAPIDAKITTKIRLQKNLLSHRTARKSS